MIIKIYSNFRINFKYESKIRETEVGVNGKNTGGRKLGWKIKKH